MIPSNNILTNESTNVLTKTNVSSNKWGASLPDALLELILYYLSSDGLFATLHINKQWNKNAMLERVWQVLIPPIAVSAEFWKVFGNIGEIPSIPRKVFLTGRSCDLSNYKLMLIPSTINGIPLTAYSFCKHIRERASSVHATFSCLVEYDLLEGLKKDQLQRKSRWVLMSQTVRPHNAEPSPTTEISNSLEVLIHIFNIFLHYIPYTHIGASIWEDYKYIRCREFYSLDNPCIMNTHVYYNNKLRSSEICMKFQKIYLSFLLRAFRLSIWMMTRKIREKSKNLHLFTNKMN